MSDIKAGELAGARRMERPKTATRLLTPAGEDKGDWAWFIGSGSVPHRYGAFDEAILYLNEQTIRVTVSRRRKKVRVSVNGEDWSRAALKEAL
jgi:hypothetical protein